MKTYKFFLLLLGGLCLMCWNGCKDDECFDETDPTCENYDPCLQEETVSADFHIYEAFQLGYPDDWQVYDTDTILTNRAFFVPQYRRESAVYEWQIGREVLYDSIIFRTDFPFNELVSVKLTVRDTTPNLCFPEDDRVDSLTRYFVSIGDQAVWETIYPYEGKFHGKRFPGGDTMTVELDLNYLPPGGDPHPFFGDWEFRIKGLPKSACVLNFWSDFLRINVGFRQASFGASVNSNEPCLTPMGNLFLPGSDRDSIYINYSHQQSEGGFDGATRDEFVFRGARVY